MIQPIKPTEVTEKRKEQIPYEVIEAWNGIIAKNYHDKKSVLTQMEIISLICHSMNCERDKIFKENWLDIEDIYRESGWDVFYDKPAYCENYEASFTFKSKN